MRNAVRPILLGAALALACAAAHAQPPAAASRKEPDARCRDIASRYIHESPDKAHLTVEQEEDYEYRQEKKYLALCGDSDDDYTRRIRQSVANHEAAAQCDAKWEQYIKRFTFDHTTPERSQEAYAAAKAFLNDCGRWNTEQTRFIKMWVEKYDRAVREFEAVKSLPALVAAARARPAPGRRLTRGSQRLTSSRATSLRSGLTIT